MTTFHSLHCILILFVVSHLSADDNECPGSSQGWDCEYDSEYSNRNNEEYFCDLDVLSPNTSIEIFEKEYYMKKPVIIDANINDWIGNKSFWNRDYLSSDSYLRNHKFNCGESLRLVFNQGQGITSKTLKEYINWVKYHGDEENNLEFLFDNTVWDVFHQHNDLPINTNNILLFNITSNKIDYNIKILTIGITGTGAAFHSHGENWLFLLFGRKRWFLYPPELCPPGGFWPGYSSIHWFKNVYPKIINNDENIWIKPIECIQKEGQIMYLPEFMWHSVLNIGDVIAIAIQNNGKGVYTSFMKERGRKDTINEYIDKNKNILSDLQHDMLKYEIYKSYKKLQQYSPLSAMNEFMIGYIIFEMKQSRNLCRIAIEHLNKAIKMDSFYLEAYMTLARIYGNQETYCWDFKKAITYYKIAYNLNQYNPLIQQYFVQFLTKLDDSNRTIEMMIGNIQSGLPL